MVKPYLSVLCVSLVFIAACRTPAPATTEREPLIEDVEAAEDDRAQNITGVSELALRDAPEVHPLDTPMMQLELTSSRVRYEFGQGDRGFVLWRSASGKLVALMRFEDSNGDGRIEPEFGQHGEALVDGPSAYLVDVYSGQMTRVAEVLTWDASSRYIAVRPVQESATMQIWDAEEMTRITVDESWGVELDSDGNACLGPRQVHLASDGTFWGIEKGERGVIGRALDGNGEDVRIAVGEDVRVWRIEPAARDWLSIMYVEEDTDRSGALDLPEQNTSCACRFCGRFAASMGVYGWRGDAWRVKLASPGGEVSSALDGFAAPLTSRVFVDAASEHLLSWPDGKALDAKVPRGCARAPWLTGEAPRVVLTCEDGRTLLWEPSLQPATHGLPITILAATEQHVATSAAGTHWFGAVVKLEQSAELRAARVRMEDGLVQVVDRVYETVPSVRVDEQGIMEVVADGEVTFLEISSGRQWRGVSEADKRLVYASGGEAMHVSADKEGTFILPGGCVLEPMAVEQGIERGPWQVSCVETSAVDAPEQ